MILKHRSLCIFLVFAFLGTLLAGAGITAKPREFQAYGNGTVDTSWYDPRSAKEYAISSAPQLAGLGPIGEPGKFSGGHNDPSAFRSGFSRPQLDSHWEPAGGGGRENGRCIQRHL